MWKDNPLWQPTGRNDFCDFLLGSLEPIKHQNHPNTEVCSWKLGNSVHSCRSLKTYRLEPWGFGTHPKRTLQPKIMLKNIILYSGCGWKLGMFMGNDWDSVAALECWFEVGTTHLKHYESELGSAPQLQLEKTTIFAYCIWQWLNPPKMDGLILKVHGCLMIRSSPPPRYCRVLLTRISFGL